MNLATRLATSVEKVQYVIPTSALILKQGTGTWPQSDLNYLKLDKSGYLSFYFLFLEFFSYTLLIRLE